MSNIGTKLTKYTLPRKSSAIIIQVHKKILPAVGSGSAGSVIASRLSENPNVSVLVLEAGGLGGRFLDIPNASPFLHKTIYDWQHKIVPQKHACGAFENNVKKFIYFY